MFGEQCAGGHTEHVRHGLPRDHGGDSARLLAFLREQFRDQRGRAEECAMREAGDEPRGDEHRRIHRGGAQRVAGERDDDEGARWNPAPEHEDERAHAHADRICGDEIAGERDAHVHRLRGLRQDAHHHEFGRAEHECAGGEREQAEAVVVARGMARVDHATAMHGISAESVRRIDYHVRHLPHLDHALSAGGKRSA